MLEVTLTDSKASFSRKFESLLQKCHLVSMKGISFIRIMRYLSVSTLICNVIDEPFLFFMIVTL